MHDNVLNQSPLGKNSEYISHYCPDLLYPILRKTTREQIRISPNLPFKGEDVWKSYELSWLNEKGKPIIAIGEFVFSCASPFLIESKSFKLYLNSFSQTRFPSISEVQMTLEKDLSQASGSSVKVKLIFAHEFSQLVLCCPEGICLDDQDIEMHEHEYNLNPCFLQIGSQNISETLYTNLFKSNCLVTGQPDWITVSIQYSGHQIKHDGLLKYLVSFRNHQGFHEQCIEKIFDDLMKFCQPHQLAVYGQCTRRGGIDINSLRTNFVTTLPNNTRHPRQ